MSRSWNPWITSYTLYIQPAINDLSDLKALVIADARYPITPNIFFKSSLSLKYHSEPYDTLNAVNLELKNAISITF